MMILAWIFVIAALGLQILNIAWAISFRRLSQVYLVPVILWYVALVLRKKGVFILSAGEEIAWVFGIHLVLSILIFLVGNFFKRSS